ncbi:hypothetical protein CYMTET_22974 [Cymbomonas tetramitiformis]|uniref:Uncharacterized protein n=1 Tax=Cymbomonas tetramitiformis TaxID=36881 RepID=A0AAE0FYV6_9CHLO|nr:hypothetical protein CYMTET_22974 [Cymbomonas tetramitiformis]
MGLGARAITFILTLVLWTDVITPMDPIATCSRSLQFGVHQPSECPLYSGISNPLKSLVTGQIHGENYVASTGLIFVCARLWSWDPKGCLQTQLFRLATLTSLYSFWNPWYSTVIYIFDVFDTHPRPDLSKCLFSVALTTITLSFVNWRLLHYLATAKKKWQTGHTDLEEPLVSETPDFHLTEINPSQDQ